MTLHILWKDIRRLWPAIAASLAVLGVLTREDRWRGDWLVGATEGYLNLLVPIVWACLLALAVEQDPIPGDRQFWITRPFPRPALLAAKLLFAVLFVHLPSLVSDSYILAARGFSPVAYAPHLLTKQLILACALTIPAIALAAIVRNFSHFVLEIVALAAIFFVISGPFTPPVFFVEWEPLRTARFQLVVTMAVCAGAAMIGLQYFGRRTLLSRGIATVAAIAGALTFVLLLPPAALAIRTRLSPPPARPGILFDGSRGASNRPYAGDATAAVPILYVLPEGLHARPDLLRSEISTSSGAHYSELRASRYDAMRRRTHDTYLDLTTADSNARGWLILRIDPRLFASIEQPVTLRGEVSLGLYRLGEPNTLPIGAAATIASVGRCATSVVDVPLRDSMIKVECESPERAPSGTRVRLLADGREWNYNLGNARSFGAGPGFSWLSPLYRDLTYFTVNDRYDYGVPHAALPDARIEITPRIPLGYAAVHYELRDIDLRKYVVERPTRAAAR